MARMGLVMPKALGLFVAAPQWNSGLNCHGFDGKVPDSAVMTTRAGSILVMDYS
jgi:hypothetical protein